MTSWWECCAAQMQKSLVCTDVRVSRRTESCLRSQGSFWKNEWIEENVKETGCWGARERWCFILFVVFFTKLSMKLKKNNCLLIWFPGPLDTWYKNIWIILNDMKLKFIILYAVIMSSHELYSIIQYCVAQYNTLHYSTVQYSILYYSIVQYSTVKYSAVWYGTVLYGMVLNSTIWYSKLQYITV